MFDKVGTVLPGRSYAIKKSMVAIESADDIVGRTNHHHIDLTSSSTLLTIEIRPHKFIEEAPISLFEPNNIHSSLITHPQPHSPRNLVVVVVVV